MYLSTKIKKTIAKKSITTSSYLLLHVIFFLKFTYNISKVNLRVLTVNRRNENCFKTLKMGTITDAL